MKKRLLAFLLSLAMVAGMLPMSAIEAKAAETDEIILADNVTGNNFTDTTANPDESYVYTIEGSDGSVQEIVVLAEGEEETGNSVIEETVTEKNGTEYVLADSYESGKTYVLVSDTNYALASDGTNVSAVEVTIDSNKITGPLPELEWTISNSESNNYYYFVDTTGKYLYIETYGVLLNTEGNIKIRSKSLASTSSTSGFDIGNYSWYGLVLDGSTMLTKYNSYTMFYLYAKTEGNTGTGSTSTAYVVDTTGLDNLISECDKLLEQNYSADSWTGFETALTAAKDAKAALVENYDTEEAANAALVEIDAAHNALLAAKKALVQLETFTIRPTWQRTLEPANRTYGDNGGLLVDVEYITNAPSTTDAEGNVVNDTNYSIITWKDKAEDIFKLSTDSSMTVWDYNTNAQYATGVGKVANVSAATWNEHEETSGDAWRYGSVRRFTGTFKWPEGYDVDDTVIYQSVNDENYKAIYEYINSDPTLKARYGASKVYPINDDMFVFIRKAGDELSVTDLDYLNHMLFWTGSSGKGVWSSNPDNGSGDWDRTVTPTFNGKNALPAYYRILPNNNDNTGVQATSAALDYSKFQHTDGWYTLVDSNTVMSTVKNLYGVEDLSNQEMIIDIFCFDNSSSGGMDEIELIFQRTPKTATSVQVNYYLDSVLAVNLLGTTYMTNVEDKTEIELHSGTNVNELDHYRYAAAVQAGTVVTPGVQQEPVPYVVDINKERNIINVVYKFSGVDDRHYYFYDFGVTNEYIYTPLEESHFSDAKITSVDNTNPDIGVSIINDGKDLLLTYTPKTSKGDVAVATLNIHFDGYSTEVKPVVIAPASNVLYEENFMTQSTNTESAVDWTRTEKDIESVEDNEKTVFGYTDSYSTSTGHSGTVTAVVDETNTLTENLTFDFVGTGFDLIGTCGPNTGTIAVRVVNSEGKAVKNFLVDTAYVDKDATIYQVPLLQTKDLPEDTYTATVRGSYIVYGNTTSTYALDARGNVGERDTISDLYELMYGVGMTEDDIDSVEYINMGRLMGASTYAMSEASETAQTTEAPSNMIIELDGFRSYRSTDYNKYPKNELGAIYLNILDCVGDEISAYIEAVEDGTYKVNEYELLGGPQNEIYLTKTNAGTTGLVIGKVTSANAHISLRSVDGKEVVVKVNGDKTIELKHTTEMYYKVSANADGYIVLQVVDGFLGIGNLKLTSGNAEQAAVSPAALTEDDYALVATTMRLYAAAPEDPEVDVPEVEVPEEENKVFEPKKLQVTTTVKNNKYTVTVVTSDDVKYITVNGTKISKATTKRGSTDKTFTYSAKINKNTTVELEIVAYDSDKLASEAVVCVVENEVANNKPGNGNSNNNKPGNGNSNNNKPGNGNSNNNNSGNKATNIWRNMFSVIKKSLWK